MKNYKYILSYIGFLGVVVLSCTSASKKAAIEPTGLMETFGDTIRFEGFGSDKTDSCYVLNNKFHKHGGIYIADYYAVSDSLNLNDSTDILVLSPSSLESDGIICKADTFPKRILLVIDKNHGKVLNNHSNLISDIGGVLNQYGGLNRTKEGFEIIHQAGARYSWTYKIGLSISNGKNLKIIKVEKTCTFDGQDKTTVRKYSNLSADKINISDTLKADCNCDKIWRNMER